MPLLLRLPVGERRRRSDRDLLGERRHKSAPRLAVLALLVRRTHTFETVLVAFLLLVVGNFLRGFLDSLNELRQLVPKVGAGT